MVLGGGAHQINVILCLTGDERFSIDISSIYQMMLRQEVLVLESRVNFWKLLSIWNRADSGDHVCNQVWPVFITRFRKMNFIPNPIGRAFLCG